MLQVLISEKNIFWNIRNYLIVTNVWMLSLNYSMITALNTTPSKKRLCRNQVLKTFFWLKVWPHPQQSLGNAFTDWGITKKYDDPICMIKFIPWTNNKQKTIYNSVLVKRMKKSEKFVTFTKHLNVCRKSWYIA